MATDPLFIDASGGAPSYSSSEYRQGLAALLAGPSPVQVFSGVRCGTITVVGSAITVPAPVGYVLNGGNAPGSEGFYCGSFQSGDADLSKTLTAAHATLDRIDRILIRVYNDPLDSSGLRRQNIEYQVGTPASTPVAPTLPTNAVEVALISVPHSGGGSPVVTMTAKPPVAAGGARPGSVSGDLEIYDIVSGLWRRVYQTIGAHFMGGYDPGGTSGITNNTWVPLPVTTTESSSRITLTGGNSLTIGETGLYQCDGKVQMSGGSAGGNVRGAWWVNGVEKRENPITATTAALPIALSCKLKLNAGDVLQYMVRQETGAARNFVNGVLYNFMDVARIS